MKRTFDLAAAALGLIVLSPLFLLLALWIKRDSPGPVFYRGVRGARGGGSFRIFKFRSMVQNADKTGQSSSGSDDARVTPSGHFIRRFKFDEFAQLINVFLGDMSLVGPRPEVLKYTENYTGEFREILTARPGITDWASIWNNDEGAVLAGYPDADLAYEQLIQPTKLQLQLRYVRHRTFGGDIKILFSTVWVLVNRDFYPRELQSTPRLKKRF
ncbi:MAG: sugar transferase [Gemmatimonadetes bacterium]|nr:sugar transferase [Gemmatimonadota bacterium]